VIACTHAGCTRPAFVHVYGLGDRCASHVRAHYETATFEVELRPLAGMTDALRAIVTSVRIVKRGGHESLAVWNRSGLSGSLTVQHGDAFTIAARLLGIARGGE